LSKLSTIFQTISYKHANLITQTYKPVPGNFYRLIPTARNSEAVVRPIVTPFDNEKPRIEANLGFARKAKKVQSNVT